MIRFHSSRGTERENDVLFRVSCWIHTDIRNQSHIEIHQGFQHTIALTYCAKLRRNRSRNRVLGRREKKNEKTGIVPTFL